MGIELRLAEAEDWPLLEPFYTKAYRPRHPLQNFDFWKWQYGNEKYGRAYIITDNDEIVAHLGANTHDGFSWPLNLYILPEYRGNGWVKMLYDKHKEANPLASLNAHGVTLGIYRKWDWYRYYDLQRYIAINPEFDKADQADLLSKINQPLEYKPASGHYYWEQPGIKGIEFKDGSTAVMQPEIGGLRFMDVLDPIPALEEAWNLGFKWADYVTSWNDHKIVELERKGWVHDSMSKIPWYLSPVVPESRCQVSFNSDIPVQKTFIVKRYHADHGRVGSL